MLLRRLLGVALAVTLIWVVALAGITWVSRSVRVVVLLRRRRSKTVVGGGVGLPLRGLARVAGRRLHRKLGERIGRRIAATGRRLGRVLAGCRMAVALGGCVAMLCWLPGVRLLRRSIGGLRLLQRWLLGVGLLRRHPARQGIVRVRLWLLIIRAGSLSLLRMSLLRVALLRVPLRILPLLGCGQSLSLCQSLGLSLGLSLCQSQCVALGRAPMRGDVAVQGSAVRPCHREKSFDTCFQPTLASSDACDRCPASLNVPETGTSDRPFD